MGICDGRTVIITGAARGLGRAYALAFGAEGANVVVNDIGTSLHGEGRDTSAADAVVEEIRSAGGKALANYEDVTDWDAAKRIVDAAVATFGDLHVVVNNAGIVRDRMFVSATLEEWDATMHVHLRPLLPVASRRKLLARKAETGCQSGSKDHQHDFRCGPARQHCSSRLFDCQGRNRIAHAGASRRIGPIWHYVQCTSPICSHPHDGTGLRRKNGHGRAGVRCHGPGQYRTDSCLAGLRRIGTCDGLRL